MQPRGAESFASSILIGQRVRHPAITRTPRQSNLSATRRASISKNKSRAPLSPRNRQGSGVVERLIPRVPLALAFLRNYRAENDGVEYRAFRRSPAWAMSRNATQSFVAGAYRNATVYWGREDLSLRIEWTARTQGPEAGYDIKSFSEDGSEIFIEVKTTNGHQNTPFLITANEVRVSEELGKSYRLYRVFDFSRQPKIYVLHGSIKDSCSLDPRVYSARPV